LTDKTNFIEFRKHSGMVNTKFKLLMHTILRFIRFFVSEKIISLFFLQDIQDIQDIHVTVQIKVSYVLSN